MARKTRAIRKQMNEQGAPHPHAASSGLIIEGEVIRAPDEATTDSARHLH